MTLIFTHRMGINRVYKTFASRVKSKKSVSYFTITLSLLSLSFFGLFAIRPTLITGFSLMKNVSDQKKLNVDYENKITSVIRAQSEYELIRNNLPLIERAIPDRAQFQSLAYSLEEIAQQSELVINQLQIDGVPVSAEKPSDTLKEYKFNLMANGSFESAFSFITHLINLRRIVTIQSLELIQDSNAESTESGSIRLTLKGNTYYEP